MSGLVLDGFAGPGGWDVALNELGIGPVVGIEKDAAACLTRAAAGHVTIRADVSRYPVGHLAGKVSGAVWSPPCTTFSAAGDQAGNAIAGLLVHLVADMFAGRDTRAEHRAGLRAALTESDWATDLPPAKRTAKIAAAVTSAALVAEPARYIEAASPEWIALEQVPSVLPLWQAYAAHLSTRGYSVWTGVLNAADYGVPQTRKRAILITSRVRRVSCPEPTHYDPQKGHQLWGEPWVSMAEALGWGATGRVAPTVTAGGTATGGAEPFGHRDRDALTAERQAGRWELRRLVGRSIAAGRRPHPLHEPAPTITGGSEESHGTGPRLSWVLHTNRDQRPDGTRQTVDPSSAPAPALTAKSGGQWVVKPADEVEQSIRITVQEAAILQSFPPGYPWRGTKTRQFQQVGNAIPPLLAAHVLAEATGVRIAQAAA